MGASEMNEEEAICKAVDFSTTASGLHPVASLVPLAYHPGHTEAKRASRNPREGEEQLRQYITEIARKQDFAPFGFMGIH